MDSPFFNELVERLRMVRLDALPAVVAALDAAAARRGVPPRGTSAPIAAAPPVDHLAGAVVKASIGGSKLEAVERAVVLHAVHTCGGNVSAAARLLGIDRKALERRYRRYANAREKTKA